MRRPTTNNALNTGIAFLAIILVFVGNLYLLYKLFVIFLSPESLGFQLHADDTSDSGEKTSREELRPDTSRIRIYVENNVVTSKPEKISTSSSSSSSSKSIKYPKKHQKTSISHSSHSNKAHLPPRKHYIHAHHHSGSSSASNRQRARKPRPTTTTPTSSTSTEIFPLKSIQIPRPDRIRRPDSVEIFPKIQITAAELKRLESRKKDTSLPAVSKTPQEISNVTLVTALLDIGRERWAHYGRPFFKYHKFMSNVLRLRMPMVVFIDERSLEFVRKEREDVGLLRKTKIHIITIEDLPLFAYHQQMIEIMNHELYENGWKVGVWDEAMKQHPETCNYKYDLLVNSKPYFLFNASTENPFDSKYFTWIDAGYGHGKEEYFPPEFRWLPVFVEGKISIIKLTPIFDKIARYQISHLYRQDIAVVSGGFLAGDRQTLASFYQHYHWKIIRLLTYERIVDDDQTILVLLINEIPDLFNVVQGDWFDAFRLF